jgi:hypothetical protein
MWLAGHIKVLGGPYVARGPDVAQACSNLSLFKSCTLVTLELNGMIEGVENCHNCVDI